MSDFKVGDLVQFIPENFDRRIWKWAYIGIGYIESIEDDEESLYFDKSNKVYKIFCGKVIRQQINNFAELELKDATVNIDEKYMDTVCKKATLQSIEEL